MYGVDSSLFTRFTTTILESTSTHSLNSMNARHANWYPLLAGIALIKFWTKMGPKGSLGSWLARWGVDSGRLEQLSWNWNQSPICWTGCGFALGEHRVRASFWIFLPFIACKRKILWSLRDIRPINSISTSIFKDWASKFLKMTKTLQTSRCQRKHRLQLKTHTVSRI